MTNEAADSKERAAISRPLASPVDQSAIEPDLSRALQESEDRFRAAISAIQGVLWTNNATGEMTGNQPGWAALTGQTYEEYQGYGWSSVVHPDDAQPTIDAWSVALQTQTPFVFEHRVRVRSGRWELFAIRAVPVLNDDGTIREWVGVHTNITESRAAERALEASEQRYRSLSEHLDQQVGERTQELRMLIEDLERSNQNLQQFAYVASHDLQEPLRKIQSFADILRTRYSAPLNDGSQYLDRIQLSAGRMSTLIRDLLAYARISTRQEVKTTVPLGQVVQQALIDLELVISEAKAVIDIGPLPTVQGDPTQLGQLFQNLLSNALKFRRKDALGEAVRPHIRVSAQRIGMADLPDSVQPARPAAAYEQIEVTDNGIGFDQRYADRIFQVFQRLHGKNDFTGTGIGLAICQKVTANHGGAITAISQPGEGATFRIYLPQSA